MQKCCESRYRLIKYIGESFVIQIKFLSKFYFCLIGEEEKEEVKDAVEDEPKVEDTPQEDEESFDQEESEDEDESGMKSFILSFDISLFFWKIC